MPDQTPTKSPMMISTSHRLPTFLTAGLLVASLLPTEANAGMDELFVRRVAPLLNEKCLACHGANGEKIEGELDLRSRESMLKGGASRQAAVVNGSPEKSPLYLAVIRKSDDWSAMPPKEADRLTDEQVGWIKQWIEGGASWPDEARVREIQRANADKWAAEDGQSVATSGGLSHAWTNRKYKPESLWAYRPIVKRTGMARGIDGFIEDRFPAGVRRDGDDVARESKAPHPQPLSPQGRSEGRAASSKLMVAPRADRRTLIRRATFDLIGLPPTPDEVTAFLADHQPDQVAFSKVVDRLLASPHYGERMAQHWLDVVRYADSSGFANDYERGNAWRYRDYVVRSFNDDKPYDQFVREQLAGDEIDPGNPELLIATGFLRMGPWELTGMEVAKVARQRFLDDVTNSVGETFLSHSLQCARCHDHKFDPIPTGDYYSVQAVFATTQLAERPASFLPCENRDGFEEKRFLEQRRGEYIAMLTKLDEKLLASAQEWFKTRKLDPTEWNATVEEARSLAKNPSPPAPLPTTAKPGARRDSYNVFNAARNRLLQKGVAEGQFPPKLLDFTPEDYGNERVARKGLERLAWEFDRYEPFALSVYGGRTPTVKSVNAPVRLPANRLTDGELEEAAILIGGDPFSNGPKVKPGALSVLATTARLNADIPSEVEGRRKAFAEWVVSKSNPLTARSIVNRIWLWHFGTPLAGNPNNFGSTGKRPTHPELLDWLAATFVEDGWSFKCLHRRIMASDVYCRSSVHPESAMLSKLDPLGTSYAVFSPRRLTAEELRDAMLAATGELNPAVGGIPNRPEINRDVAFQPRQVMGTFAAAWTPNPLPHQRHRRSIYALKLRGLADPMLEVFNAPASDFSCERRETSTVTPQAFCLFNGQSTHDRSLALAHRAVKEAKSDEQAVARCFQWVYSRDPNDHELRTCLAHWRDVAASASPAVVDPVPPPLEIRRDAIEENTGEPFSFIESLPAYREFVPDLQPRDVDARTRALADLCLVLFNSNEFAFVD